MSGTDVLVARLVARGDVPEDLLDTYDAERRPAGVQAIRGTGRLVRTQAQQNPLLRNLIGAVALRLPAVQRRIADTVSRIGVDYGSQPLQWAPARPGRARPPS